MLKGFKEIMDNVINKGFGSNKRGNIEAFAKVDLFKGKIIEVRHYNNVVAIVEYDAKRIIKNNKFWNYSQSTTRLCNDIISYFDKFQVV